MCSRCGYLFTNSDLSAHPKQINRNHIEEKYSPSNYSISENTPSNDKAYRKYEKELENWTDDQIIDVAINQQSYEREKVAAAGFWIYRKKIIYLSKKEYESIEKKPKDQRTVIETRNFDNYKQIKVIDKVGPEYYFSKNGFLTYYFSPLIKILLKIVGTTVVSG
jgi:hypothetical protein